MPENAKGEYSRLLLSGENRLIPDCISFRSIPHTTKLFADFLSHSPEIRRFFPYSCEPQEIARRASAVPHSEIHQKVATALERQNRAWGASDKTLANIARLREGAHAVVTGQQVGLFGGPLLSLFKVASVLALAKQVQNAGVDCVPVFWMATEDHDLAEVNQSLLLNADFQLAPFTVETEGKADSPVANVRLA